MGQDSSIAAPGAGEYLFEKRYGHLLFHESETSCLVELLVVPLRPGDGMKKSSATGGHENRKSSQRTRKSVAQSQESCNGASPKNRLSCLPVELLSLVFRDLKLTDTLNLALTSRFHWQVGRKHLQAFSMSLLGTWAGKNIVCVGEGIKDGDYPAKLFTDDEAAEFLQLDCNLFDFLRYEGHAKEVDGQQKTPFDSLLAANSNEYLCLSEVDRADLRRVLGFSQFYGTKEDAWILRNLTTKEFVRSEAIAIRPDYIHGPHIDHIGFGKVVISRTGWSSSLDTSVRRGGLHRGVWAGHAFDITTMKRHQKEAKEGEWKDSSQELGKEIAAIWSKYGKNWRQNRENISMKKVLKH